MRQEGGVLPEGCHGVPEGMLHEVHKGMRTGVQEAVPGKGDGLLRQGGNGEAVLQAILNGRGDASV